MTGRTHAPGYLPLIAVFLVAIVLRWDIAEHFTHIDDIGVATTLRDIDSIHTAERLAARIASRAGPKTRILRRVTDLPGGGALIPAFAFARRTLEFSHRWTYAPLQFVMTDQLIAGAATYRDTLRRGRIPSWIAAMCVMWLMFLLARRLWPEESAIGLPLVVATLAGVSAEMVVYSKQMESYAIGPLGLAVQLLLLLSIVRRDEPPGMPVAALIGLTLGLLSSSQYQLLVFTPAFFGAWLLMRRTSRDIRSIAACGAAWLLFAVPLYAVYLRFLGRSGVNWNAGPTGEFAFHPARTPLAVLTRVLTFFPRNAFLAFEATVSPVVDSHPLYRVVGIALSVVALIGAVALARREDVQARAFVRFAAVLLLIHSFFTVLHRSTLGPTRHTLVLLPIALVCIGAGLSVMQAPAGNRRRLVSLTVVVAFCALSLLDMPRVAEARRDPINEERLRALFAEHRVSAVIQYGWTYNVSLMPSVLARFALFEDLPAGSKGEWITRPPADLDRIALLSTRASLTSQLFDSLRTAFNTNQVSMQAGLILPPRSDYRVVASEVRRSDVEVDISRRTHNGTNELFLYILERTPVP